MIPPVIRLPALLATGEDSRQWLEANGFTVNHFISRFGAYSVTPPYGWSMSGVTVTWFLLYNERGVQMAEVNADLRNLRIWTRETGFPVHKSGENNQRAFIPNKNKKRK